MDTAGESYDRLQITHRLTLKELSSTKRRMAELEAELKALKLGRKGKGIKAPKNKNHAAAGFAAGTWLFLQTTGWLPYAEPYLWLKSGFFADANMAGYCTIFLAWIYREGREWFGV